ncbi:hypothetical protein CEUSTIGMA_g12643.t1 [Chlamydomonas eustigma]|uniref:Uncharacterized protein n=1 Tax=Chlamydomonas eustigma TaxID=1157962 RepID=A0A250XQC1_9CHLO|nr:hypothetical protein CEUSTIGMA_g12643.t1 [Chlamydomonas eustigma]|eukprot:GAX85223.1 hypothetical protein CEUSTIGMA_g12643.t1 [Chlamydomonas eustigma]
MESQALSFAGDAEDDDAGSPSEGSEEDSEYEERSRKKKTSKLLVSTTSRKSGVLARAKTQRKRLSRRDEDSDEEDDFIVEDSEEEYVPKKKHVTVIPARPRRQAAQQTSRKRDADESEEEDADDSSEDADEIFSEPSAQSSASEDEEEGVDEDEHYAKHLHDAFNRQRATRGASKGEHSGRGRNSKPGQRLSRRAAASKVVTYEESDDEEPDEEAQQQLEDWEDDLSDGQEDIDDSDASGRRKRGRPNGQSRSNHQRLNTYEEHDGDQSKHLEVERVLAHREKEGGGGGDESPDPWSKRELQIKWKGSSYIHCTWEDRASLSNKAGSKRVLNYIKKADDLESSRPFISREEQELRDVERQMEEQLVLQHSVVERICGERTGVSGTRYLVKWEGLPYSEATWESEQDVLAAQAHVQIQGFRDREARLQTPHFSVEAQRRMFKVQGTRALVAQPDFLSFGKLRDYQLDGLNWMVYSWSQNRNVILADEMGLGKTVQCVSLLGYMSEVLSIRGPFLVVVPLSTVPNWIREFKRWTPMMSTVVYVGDSTSREAIRSIEFDVGRRTDPTAASGLPTGCTPRTHRFEVIITTYELILKDAHILGKIDWSYLVVDEAHRLKNAESALYQELLGFSFRNKLLVTGTPLQNSLKELWALLHFLEPDKFPDSEAFEEEYSTQTMDGVSSLHAVLRPHLLRRVIKEVERSLPPKNERILRVEMTPLQRQYYKWILTRNFKDLNKGTRGGGQVSLLNIITELKKCCNHPFLFESAEEGYRGQDGDTSVVDRLIVTSGKMVLLDKLLKRLKDTGHRVLIFSQMVRMLDIVSDYMRLRGFQHQRLDGSTPAAARHQAMEQFNRPDSTDFAFLLSTRAGGLGINLATADTVIIFDSDWNPQNDLQAMSRAHRIGQTETVNIYRLLTSGSVEEDILERAKRKMVLDHLVIQKMDTSGRLVLDPAGSAASTAGGTSSNPKQMFGKDELAAILRFGAEDLFKQEAANAASGQATESDAERARRIAEEDIDAILDRAEVVDNRPEYADQTAEGGSGSAAGGADAAGGPPSDLLTSFNVATFKNEEDDATFWSRLIPVTARPKEEHQEELLPRAAKMKLLEEDTTAAASRAQRREHRSSMRASAYPGSEPGPPVEGALLRIDEWLLDVDEHGVPLKVPSNEDEDDINLRTLSRRDANAFSRAARRLGLSSRVDEICAEAGGKAFEEATHGQKLALFHTFMDGCRRAVDLAGDDPKDAVLDFFGAAVKAHEVVQYHSQMRQLERLVAPVLAAAEAVQTSQQAGPGRQQLSSSFKLPSDCILPCPKWGKIIGWNAKEDAMLLMGVYLYGLGRWDKMANDPRLQLADKLTGAVNGASHGSRQRQHASGSTAAVDCGGEEAGSGLPKASQLETRVLSLLRKLLSAKKLSSKVITGNTKQGSVVKRPLPGLKQTAKRSMSVGGTPRRGSSIAKAAAARALGDESIPSSSREAQAAENAFKGRQRAQEYKASTNRNPDAEKSQNLIGAKRKQGKPKADDLNPARKRWKPTGSSPEPSGGSPKSPASLSSKDAAEFLSGCTSDLKALRKLQRGGGGSGKGGTDGGIPLSASEAAARTKQLLAAIGRTIDGVVARKGAGLGLPLWDQVSKVTDCMMPGDRLQALYAKIKAVAASKS